MDGERSRRTDWVGRGVGLAVFAAGIGMLGLVFAGTFRLGQMAPHPGQKLDQWAISFGVEVARLLASGLVASWICGRGAQLYGAAGKALTAE